MSKIYYVDGNFVSAEEAQIPITDLAIVRGYGVFDFFRTYDGLPIQLERNVSRLRRSADVLGLALAWSNEQIADAILETVRRNGFEESNVRVIVTGGDALDFITPQDKPRLLVYVEPLKPLPATWYNDGVKVITVREERYLPTAKSLNYIPAIIAMRQARAEGAVEALYVDRDGFVREGTTTNLFAFYGDKVVTPEVDILPGVTRGRVLEILSENYTVEVRPISYEELLRAQDLVITAANKQVVPVVQIDHHVLGDEPGAWSRKLMEDFRVYIAAEVARRDSVGTSTERA